MYDRAKISRCFENSVQRSKDDDKNPTTHLLHKIKHFTIHIFEHTLNHTQRHIQNFIHSQNKIILIEKYLTRSRLQN